MNCYILLENGGRVIREEGGGFLLLEDCVPTEDVVLLGGKAYFGHRLDNQYSYTTNHQKYIAAKEELARIEQSLDKNEKIVNNVIGVDEFAAEKADTARYNAAVALAQQEIKQLLSQKAALMRLIDEEETIMVILLSQPFVH